MTSPNPLDDAFRSSLLASAVEDAPPPASLARELARLGLAPAVVVAATVATTGAASGVGAAGAAGAAGKAGVASFLSLSLAKAAVVATTLAVVGVSSYQALRAPDAPAPVAVVASAGSARVSGSAKLPVVPAVQRVADEMAVAAPVELPPAAPSATPQAAIVIAPRVTTSVPPRVVPSAPPPAVAPSTTTALPAQSALSAEVALVDRARALAHRSPGEALGALEERDRRFPAGVLADEVAVVRVDALLAAGRRSDAERVAAPYLQGQHAPLREHLRLLLGATTSSGP